MYKFSSKIRYSEVGSDSLLTLPALVNYFQDCTTFQTEGTPGSLEGLMNNNMAWLLASWQIVINRYPKLYEEVNIGTVPYLLKGPFGHRNFLLETKDGEILAMANSIWLLFDMEKNYPARLPEEFISSYPLEEKLDMDYAPRKLPFPKEGDNTEFEPFTVTKWDLDTNNHMNNERYIAVAADCLPKDAGIIRQMRAEYKYQAFQGDVIYPVLNTRTDGDMTIYTVGMNRENNEPYCTVEFITAADLNNEAGSR